MDAVLEIGRIDGGGEAQHGSVGCSLQFGRKPLDRTVMYQIHLRG